MLLVFVLGLHQLCFDVLAVLRGIVLLLLHGCKYFLVVIDDALHFLIMLLLYVLDVDFLLPLQILVVVLQLPDFVLLVLQFGLHFLFIFLDLLHLSKHFVVSGLGLLQLFLLLLYDFHVLCVEISQILAIFRLFGVFLLLLINSTL